MQILKQNLQIDFMGKRKLAMFFSITLILVALGSLLVRGLNLGIDFTGGTLVEAGFPQAVGRFLNVRFGVEAAADSKLAIFC